MQFFFSISSGNQNAADQVEIQKASLFVFQHLDNSFERTESVQDGGSVFENSAGILRLNKETGFMEYTVQNGVLRFNEDGNINDITSGDVIINSFYLERIEDSEGTTTGIRVSIDMTSSESGLSKNIETAYIIK